MNRRLAFSLSLSVAAVTCACGQTLDLGKDVPVGCEGRPTGARMLSALGAFPDFTPLAMAVVGDAAYLGGTSLPGRTFTPEARDIGRLLRVPLDGGPVTEVWRGTSFAWPIKVQGTRLLFSEIDPTNVTGFPVFAGIDVYDTKTGTASQIPNLPGHHLVVSFESDANGVVFASEGSIRQTDQTSTVYTVARANFDDRTARSFFAHPTRAPQLLRRGDSIIASMAADGTESGFDDPTSQYLDLAIFSVEATTLRLERRLTELMNLRTASASGTSYAVVHADDTSYYVTTSSLGSTFTQKLPRAAANATAESVVSGGLGRPQFFGGEVLWTPAADRSMVRVRRYADADNRNGTELLFDPRRQVTAFAPDACGVTWISSSTEGDAFRVMSAPRR